MAVCDANQWVDATTPNVPTISGRVVKLVSFKADLFAMVIFFGYVKKSILSD